MHTYAISISEKERDRILNMLNSRQLIVICKSNSDACYFIIPANDTERLITAASAINRSLEKISISDLRETYSDNQFNTVFGDRELVAVLFQ